MKPKPIALVAAIAVGVQGAAAATVEVSAGSYNMDASGNTEINITGFSTGNRVFSFTPTAAGTLNTFSTLMQRRGDVSGNLIVSLFDASTPETDPAPVLASRTLAFGDLVIESQGPTTLADFSLVTVDFSAFGLMVDTDSEIGLKFELDSFATLDFAANRQDNPDPLPGDPNSTYFGYDFGGPAGVITGSGGQNFDVAYSLTVLQKVDELPPVPLPAGFPLLLAGIGALGLLRRKREACRA